MCVKRVSSMLRFKIMASVVPLAVAAVFARAEFLPGQRPCIEVSGSAVQIAPVPWQAQLHVSFTSDPRLATVRVQDQPTVDAFLEEHRNLTKLRARVEGVEPTLQEEDMPSLLDGLTVQLILTSDYFRGRVCDAFRRAAEARSVSQFIVQILEWLRDEFSRMTPQ